MTINLKEHNVSPAQALATLYNNSKPLGLGFLHFDPTPMTVNEAETLLSNQKYFDYLKGRVMKLNFENPENLYVDMYDRDNGNGSALKAILSING